MEKGRNAEEDDPQMIQVYEYFTHDLGSPTK